MEPVNEKGLRRLERRTSPFGQPDELPYPVR